MAACLLADIGFLDFSNRLSQNVRHQVVPQSWSAEDLQNYHHHPTTSLNIALGRKFQVPDDVKEIILCTHETLDRSGFPNKPRADKIPIEALILQTAEKLDRLTYVPMGKAAPDMSVAKRELFEKEVSRLATANYLFVEKFKTVLL
jgi:response regulator RpfG family c-di-GMP phosphodiesterase